MPAGPSERQYDHAAAEPVDPEMRKVMVHFVDAMRKEFAQKWPHLDPELALLKLLCERHDIKPPDMSIAAKSCPRPNSARSRRYAPEASSRPESRTSQEAPPRSVQSERSPLPPLKSGLPELSLPGPEAQRMQSQSPDIECQSVSRDSSRPPSNLSFYKGSRPNTSLGKNRPDSSLSTCYAESPLEETGRYTATPTEKGRHIKTANNMERDEDVSLDKAYSRKQAKGQDKVDHGHLREFELPTPHIDDCVDTPNVIRHSACLRDSLDARREESVAALGKTGLKSLAKVQALMEKDCLANASRLADGNKDTSDAFACRITTARQGLRGQFISKVSLLSLDVLTQEEQFWLVGKLIPIHFARDEAIFVEGEVGPKLFIVESGTCVVTKEDKGRRKALRDVKPGDSFGEMAVMYDMPRSASVFATTAVKALSLSREDIFSTVSQESLAKMRAQCRVQLLVASPALAMTSRENQQTLLKHMRTDVFNAGREIMREGWYSSAKNRRLYIIEAGTCSQKRRGSAAHEVLAPGVNFGNIEFALGCTQQSSVVATTDVSTISIGYDEIKSVLGVDAETALGVIRRSMHLELLRDAHPNLLGQDKQTLASVLDLGTFRRFAARQPILRKGDGVKHLMILVEGVCIEHEEDATELMDNTAVSTTATEHSSPGETFSTRDIVNRKGALMPYSLTAICECTVFFLPAEVLTSLPDTD